MLQKQIMFNKRFTKYVIQEWPWFKNYLHFNWNNSCFVFLPDWWLHSVVLFSNLYKVILFSNSNHVKAFI